MTEWTMTENIPNMDMNKNTGKNDPLPQVASEGSLEEERFSGSSEEEEDSYLDDKEVMEQMVHYILKLRPAIRKPRKLRRIIAALERLAKDQ